MAKFKGTNGNDTITGTAGDDTIVPLLGQDIVDGGAGYDTLTVDYSSLADAAFLSYLALQADGSWSGVLAGGHDATLNDVQFQNVEQIKFAATQGADYLTIDLGTLTPDKSRLNLDGSGGDDTLSVLGSELNKRLTLVVDANGNAKANFAALSGWDNYDIGLGLTAGNNLVLGGGDDYVTSLGGLDKIDLGGGYDRWTGLYQSITSDLYFVFTTATATATVTGDGVQLAEVKNAEDFRLETGDGNDVVTMFEGAGFFNGGGGSDELDLNPFGAIAPIRYELYQASAAVLAGAATPLGADDGITFYDYEALVMGGSSGADQFKFDASQFLLADSGFVMYFSGNDGVDGLTLDLRAQGAVRLRYGGSGSGYVEGLGSSNSVSWTGMEAMTATLGAGNDQIDFDVASKSLTVDGGAGFDVIDFHNATTGIYLNLGFTGPFTIAGIAVAISNIEGVVASKYGDYVLDSAASETIQGADGNDTVRVVAASSAGIDTFDGGAGLDSIDYSSVGAAVYVSLAIAAAQNTGGGGTDILTGFEDLVGSAYNDILTGSAGDDILHGVDGDDVLQGGAGNDTLYGGGLGYHDTASYSAAATAVTVSLNVTTAQNTGGAGTDTLSGIGSLIGSAFNDTLTGDANANRLSGGRGADTLTGLGGADVFAYASKLDSAGSAYDTIADFSRSQGDKIDLQAVDAKDGTFDPIRVNDAFTWIGTNAFHGVSGELREVGARGGGYFVYGDTNGDKVADLTIFVNSSTALLPADILL